MTSYSFIKVGNDYVVQADDQRILKVASRRRAAQLVNEARGLLSAQAVAKPVDEPAAPSLPRETPDVP